jgi:excisionase family DNA binding protein
MLTLEEAASYLQVHPVTLRRWATSGHTPGFKLGKEWRFIKEDLEAWGRSRYANQFRQELVSDMKGTSQCHSNNAVKSGTYVSQRQMEKSLDALLERKIGSKHKSITTA